MPTLFSSQTASVIWRTRKGGQTFVTTADIAITLAVTFTLPLLLSALKWLSPALEILTILLVTSAMMPILLPLGTVLGLFALSKGRAGWAVALLTGILLSTSLMIALFYDLSGLAFVSFWVWGLYALSYAPLGVLYAGLWWITLYLRRPEAFVGSPQAS